MAIELVTGKSGTYHVDASDDRLLHKRAMGDGPFVLYGCECQMTTANNLHISEGELLVQGAFVRVTGGGEDVVITNGSQAQQRSTLVCVDYQKGSGDGIETVSFVAIDGEPSTGAPADPEYVDGDMNAGDTHVQTPFCRVTLDGLVAAEPVVLFGDFMSTQALRDSVSPTRFSPTPNTALNNYLDYATHCFRSGDVLFFHFSISFDQARTMTGSDLLFFTLPEGYRPTASVALLRMVQILTVDGGVFYRSATVASTGRVTIDSTGVDDVARLLISVAVDASTWGI